MASIFEAGQQDPVSDDMDLDATGARADGSADVDAARADVEQTRCQIGGTLDAIREKLDPPTLMEQAKATVLDTADQLADKARDTVQDITGQAKDAVHDATVGRAQHAIGGAVHSAQHTGETIMDTVRENPIPMALIGLGIGMLYMNSRRNMPRHQWNRDYNYTLPYQDRMSGGTYAPGYQQGNQPGYAMGHGAAAASGSGTAGYAGGQMGQPGQTGHPVSERLDELKDRAGDMAEQVQGRVSDVADRVQNRVSDMTSTVQDRATQFAGQVQDRAAWAQDNLQRGMQENPLAVGVVALGIGALIGLMLPSTEPENHYMGETRDRLVEQGQQVAQQVAQKVTNVAQEGLSAAKDAMQTESREQGLAA